MVICHRRRLAALWLGLAVLATVASTEIARAQTGVQLTPDGARTLLSKDVGDERWAITVGPDGTVTGNVFRAADEPPQFVWCSEDGREQEQVELWCAGTHECEDWTYIARISVPESFFVPPKTCTGAPPPPVVGRTSSTEAVGRTSSTEALGRQTYDGAQVLLSKDVDGLRWAITLQEDGTITGNVFSPKGGDPQFVWCEPADASPEPSFHCYGADRCKCPPCDASDWAFLSTVRLPAEFLSADCIATPPRADEIIAPHSFTKAKGFGTIVVVSPSGDRMVTRTLDGEQISLAIYERASPGWREAQRLAAPPGVTRFPGAVDLSDHRLIVGTDAGVLVYERTDSRWQWEATLSSPAVGDVAIDGDTVVVGAPNDDGVGAVYVFVLGVRGWRQEAVLRASDARSPSDGNSDRFGAHVDVSGDTVVVARTGVRRDPEEPRAAYVFERRGGEFVETATLSSTEHEDAAGFAQSVAVSDSTILIASEGKWSPFRLHFYEKGLGGWSRTDAVDMCSADIVSRRREYTYLRLASPVGLASDLAIAELAMQRTGQLTSPTAAYVYARGPDARWQLRSVLEPFPSSSRAPVGLGVSPHAAFVGSAFDRLVHVYDAASLPQTPACPATSDVFPSDGWRVETPESQGMDSSALEEARAYAFHPDRNTQSVLIVRNGVIVAEWYEEGRDADSFTASWSSAKSFASALIGIAIDQGLIEHIDVSMAEFIPAWRGTDHENITLRDVLGMKSGLAWREGIAQTATSSDIAQLATSERDHLAYVIQRPIAAPPGTRYLYSSGDTMLLSAVLESVTGKTAGEYAEQVLFGPLGMAPVDWWTDAVGRTLTYCCIDAPAREIAKFGLLYARGGRWGDRQIVSEDWVRRSTSAVSESDGRYGFQWRLEYRGLIPDDGFTAHGFDGQYIYVIPSLDLVVVRHGHYDKYPGPPVADPSLFERYPAMGLGSGLGTVGPIGGFDHDAFMRPILDSVAGPAGGTHAPHPSAPMAAPPAVQTAWPPGDDGRAGTRSNMPAEPPQLASGHRPGRALPSWTETRSAP